MIKLTLKTNQPVSQSDIVINPNLSEKITAVAKTNNNGLLGTNIPVKAAHGTWQIALKSQETGFTNEESTPWRITTIPNLPPTAQINEPAEQIELLADEAVRLAGMTTDDVGLGGVNSRTPSTARTGPSVTCLSPSLPRKRRCRPCCRSLRSA